MSNVYIQEPLPTGKVVIHTNHGDLEVELWCKEAPKACRNFIQLAMEGVYDRSRFHRLVPGFCLQGGLSVSRPNESIYGPEGFPSEFHSRLRFTRRGLLASVPVPNAQNSAMNHTGFFFTLDATPELNRINTLFGRVAGDTIYNLLKMGELEVDDQEQPVYPPEIRSITVLDHPFSDLQPRQPAVFNSSGQQSSTVQIKTPQARLGNKNRHVLSFGEEDHLEEETPRVSKQPSGKIKSSHDVLAQDPRLTLARADEATTAEVGSMNPSSTPKQSLDDLEKVEWPQQKPDRMDSLQKEIEQAKQELARSLAPLGSTSTRSSSTLPASAPPSALEELHRSYLQQGKKVLMGKRKPNSKDEEKVSSLGLNVSILGLVSPSRVRLPLYFSIPCIMMS